MIGVRTFLGGNFQVKRIIVKRGIKAEKMFFVIALWNIVEDEVC